METEWRFNNDPDSWDSTGEEDSDEYNYQQATWAEPVKLFVGPIFRSMTEWDLLETPMTKDDVLDTMLWIRKLP